MSCRSSSEVVNVSRYVISFFLRIAPSSSIVSAVFDGGVLIGICCL